MAILKNVAPMTVLILVALLLLLISSFMDLCSWFHPSSSPSLLAGRNDSVNIASTGGYPSSFSSASFLRQRRHSGLRYLANQMISSSNSDDDNNEPRHNDTIIEEVMMTHHGSSTAAAPQISGGGISNTDTNVTSILCHFMLVQVDYLNEDEDNISRDDDDDNQQEIICETTPPPADSDDQQTTMASWMYRIDDSSNELEQILSSTATRTSSEDLEQDGDDVHAFMSLSSNQVWIHISNVHRDEKSATISILPNASITIDPPSTPTNIVSLRDATSNNLTTAATAYDTTAAEDQHHHQHQHQRQRRRLTPTYQAQGISNILVVRVGYRHYRSDLSADELKGRIFGIGPNAQRDVNLQRQIKKCSFNKLLLHPAPSILPKDRSYDSSPIIQGVTELIIDDNNSTTTTNSSEEILNDDDIIDVRVLENKVVSKLREWYGTQYLQTMVNHTIIVMPSSDRIKHRGRSFLAYAYLRGKVSVFNNHWGSSLSALAHELGHNWNLNHAGELNSGYADTTGYMGYGNPRGDFPLSCFNAQKNWYLKWYQERALALSLTEDDALPWTGDLAAFVDFDQTVTQQKVLIQITSRDEHKRLYFQYNRAKKFNRDTRERKDEVVFIQEHGNFHGTHGLQSWLLGGIKPPPLHEQANLPHEYVFNVSDFLSEDGNSSSNNTKLLHIQICQQARGPPGPDFVRLKIYMEGQFSNCSDHPVGAPYPTQAPTRSGMPSQTPSQSNLPTPAPSESPSQSSSPTAFCEDFEEERFFYWDRNWEHYQIIGCSTLKALRQSERDRVCHDEQSNAINACPDTCGACIDHCEDDIETTFEVAPFGDQTCQWLWNFPHWKDRLCVPDHPAYLICGETCNTCPPATQAPAPSPMPSVAVVPSSIPSELPSTLPTTVCEDSTTKFKLFPTSPSEIDCSWISRNAELVASKDLCHRSLSLLPKFCPESCGQCPEEECRDDPNISFFVNANQGYKSCQWLSSRPNPIWKALLCKGGSLAWTYCRESCNSCT